MYTVVLLSCFFATSSSIWFTLWKSDITDIQITVQLCSFRYKKNTYKTEF